MAISTEVRESVFRQVGSREGGVLAEPDVHPGARVRLADQHHGHGALTLRSTHMALHCANLAVIQLRTLRVGSELVPKPNLN